MESITRLFKIGYGPSSSHTMGPRKASEEFLAQNKNAARFEVTLFGSLAATGAGHLTDRAILETLEPTAPTTIIWEPKVFLDFHPNGMTFKAFDSKGKIIDTATVFSIGGGD
ncbi:MAG: serine dehydratase, partial [Muribaculaceae bacterium]|nr:serine dehydratase [Muribaculaceae bacterium]